MPSPAAPSSLPAVRVRTSVTRIPVRSDLLLELDDERRPSVRAARWFDRGLIASSFDQRKGIPRGDTPSGIFQVLRWLIPLNWLYRQLYIFVLLSPHVNPSSFRLPNGHLNWLCISSLSKTGFFVRVSPLGIPSLWFDYVSPIRSDTRATLETELPIGDRTPGISSTYLLEIPSIRPWTRLVPSVASRGRSVEREGVRRTLLGSTDS